MFQLYRDGLEDLLKSRKKGEDKGGPLKITLAEHSPTGLVNVCMFLMDPYCLREVTLTRFNSNAG
jgi:hypothetical protein